MARVWTYLGWGVGLIALGLFFTLYTFGALDPYAATLTLLVSVLLALGGVGFLAASVARGAWWLVVPGCVLLGTGAVVYLGTNAQVQGGQLAAILFLALALAHLMLFATNRRERWWAWLVGGTFLVPAVLLLAGASFRDPFIGPALLLGWGVVFYTLYVVMPRERSRWWTLVLATVVVIGAAFVVTATEVVQQSWLRFWPLALIVAGAGVLIWTVARWSVVPQVPTVPVEPAPATEPTGPAGSVIPVDETPVPSSVAAGTDVPPEPEATEAWEQAGEPLDVPTPEGEASEPEAPSDVPPDETTTPTARKQEEA